MEIDSSNESILVLKDIFFEKIIFENPNKLNMENFKVELDVDIQNLEDFRYNVKMNLRMSHDEDKEFKIILLLNSIFDIRMQNDTTSELVDVLIKKRTLSILFPYIRSQLTILTSQPNLNPIIFPVININNLVDKNKWHYIGLKNSIKIKTIVQDCILHNGFVFCEILYG